MPIRQPAFVLVAVTLAVAGCGSSRAGSGSANSAPVAPGKTASVGTISVPVAVKGGKPLARTELIAGADAICARLNVRLAAAKDVVSSDLAAIEAIATRRSGTERAALVELQQLTPPASMASEWQRMLDYRATVVGDLAKIAEYARENNPQGTKTVLLATTNVIRQILVAGTRAGFKDCRKIG